MKIWQKKFDSLKIVNDFTVGNDRMFDLQLAPFDVLGSIAHVMMLSKVGLINDKEKNNLVLELKNIFNSIQKNQFKIDESVEDIHSQIEFILTKKLGETGKKIHTARSRNDQVLLDMKLFLRSEIEKLTISIEKLFNILQRQSNRYKNYLLPGYTHFQVAMPSSFGLWFGAYAESLVDDLKILENSYKIINQNPLGSAAGYGTTFRIDRDITTKLLGFSSLNYNSVYAQMTRGKTEKIISFALSNFADTLSKLSMDLVLYASQNFNFVSFPNNLTTGSSIMPHKKNLDVLELIRARTNKIKSLPNEIALVLTNLPSGYHRDFQVLKENLFPAFEMINSSIEILILMIENIKIEKNILNDEKYRYIFSVGEINKLVDSGKSFRDAYKIVSDKIENNEFIRTKFDKTSLGSHKGSIGNLCNTEIKKEFVKTLSQFPFKKVNSSLNNIVL